jgi:hypothetical protein
MNLKYYRRISTTLAVVLSLSGCSLSKQGIERRTELNNTGNLVSIFVVTKNNIENDYRGEIYPLALLINDRYVNVSQDITQAVREQSSTDRILQLESPRSFLTAIKNFTVTQQNQIQGQFTVDHLAATSYVCSSLITGQGKYQGTELSTLFNRIPESLGGRFRPGTKGSQPFDETRRFAIATSQAPQIIGSATVPTDTERYRQNLIAAANDLFSRDPIVKNLPGETVVENLSITDLNRDGVPEVFGSVRKKVNDAQAVNQQTRTGKEATGSIWLTYRQSQPVVLSSDVRQQIDSRLIANLVGTIDLNGDGTDEVILQNNSYESTSFSIYEYKNDRLTEVFSGAGFGC